MQEVLQLSGPVEIEKSVIQSYQGQVARVLETTTTTTTPHHHLILIINVNACSKDILCCFTACNLGARSISKDFTSTTSQLGLSFGWGGWWYVLHWILIIAILIYRSVQPGKPVIDQKKTLSNHPTFVLANMSNYINTSRALHFHRPIFP